MNKEKVLKISWYIFLATMSILTVLFFLDIKFVVVGLNILVLDALAAGIWIFVRLCRWAGRENTGRRTVAVIALTLVELFASVIMFIGLCVYVGVYVEQTEPQTHRTFVAEYAQNMMGRGRVKLYERFGPLLLACDVDEYVGEFSLERPEDRRIYISEDGKSIVVAYFFHVPIFIIPLEPSAEPAKTPQQALLEEQLVDDTHDAFLLDTGGDLGTLLITAELAEQSKNRSSAWAITFSVWNPAEMDQPIQTFSQEVMQGILPEFHDSADVNFDGYQDFGYSYTEDWPNYWHYWLWDEEQGEFTYCAPLAEIPNPEFNADQQMVIGWLRSGAASGTHSLYRLIDGDLTLARIIKLDCFEPDTQSISIEDWLDGGIVVEYQQEYLFESEEYHMLSNWFDLDYHGEPGGTYDIFQQQPIDDTHDAFLISTGGKLGTLLVTAELGKESKDEFGTRDIMFSVWNPMEMEEPIQTFSEEVMMGVAPEFHNVVDANFDGFQDFGYLFHAGNQPNHWHYWLWDEEQAQFIYYAPLIEVSSPGFDADRQIVTGYARGSAAGGTHSSYRWMDGELVLVREITLYFDQKIVVKDLVDGQMTEVYRKEWEGEPESYDALYKWYDLDYHGEPGGLYDIFQQ